MYLILKKHLKCKEILYMYLILKKHLKCKEILIYLNNFSYLFSQRNDSFNDRITLFFNTR